MCVGQKTVVLQPAELDVCVHPPLGTSSILQSWNTVGCARRSSGLWRSFEAADLAAVMFWPASFLGCYNVGEPSYGPKACCEHYHKRCVCTTSHHLVREATASRNALMPCYSLVLPLVSFSLLVLSCVSSRNCPCLCICAVVMKIVTEGSGCKRRMDLGSMEDHLWGRCLHLDLDSRNILVDIDQVCLGIGTLPFRTPWFSAALL